MALSIIESEHTNADGVMERKFMTC